MVLAIYYIHQIIIYKYIFIIDINTFAMRVKEWYSWHFPELKDIVKDNYIFARCAAFIQVNIIYIYYYIFYCVVFIL